MVVYVCVCVCVCVIVCLRCWVVPCFEVVLHACLCISVVQEPNDRQHLAYVPWRSPMTQHPSMQSPPIRLPRLGLGFARSLAGAMWKSRACALCFSSCVSSDCVCSICFNVECSHLRVGVYKSFLSCLRPTWHFLESCGFRAARRVRTCF